MAQNHSFDIVSEIDFQEADNAVNQALKEIHQRYDLKDSNTELELNKKDKLITMNTKDDYSRKSAIDILETKFIRRNISIKALKFNEPEAASGGRLKQVINLQSGISKENAKIITKLIKESKPVSYTHLRAHETVLDLVCRLLLEKKTRQKNKNKQDN